MAGGEAAEAAPLLEGAAATERYREGCPGCRLAEANEAKTGVPCLSFLYIWVVCLVAGESPPPPAPYVFSRSTSCAVCFYIILALSLV